MSDISDLWYHIHCVDINCPQDLLAKELCPVCLYIELSCNEILSSVLDIKYKNVEGIVSASFLSVIHTSEILHHLRARERKLLSW